MIVLVSRITYIQFEHLNFTATGYDTTNLW